jgi:predicted kinase
MKTLHLPQHGLNIARASLPQVKSTDVPDYLHWLKAHKHLTSTRTEMPVMSLYPTQGNFNTTKIKALMGQDQEHLRKPLIISGDHYVIDGHHRWIALMNLNPQATIPVVMVHAKVLDLIAATQEYPKSFTKNVVESFNSMKENLVARAQETIEYLAEGVHDQGIFKAIFLAGGPGSGKDWVLKQTLDNLGLVEVNSDTAFEHLMGKAKLDKKMPDNEDAQRNAIRDTAKNTTEMKQRLALQGRNGLIINGTGANVAKYKKIKEMLESHGYDTKMLFVDTPDNVSRNRNVERGQRGGRQIKEADRAEKWRQAQDARVQFSKMFGGEHYHEFTNDADMRQDVNPEVQAQKAKELDTISKIMKKHVETPPKSLVAQKWIHAGLGKLNKLPIGNKKQQANMPLPAESTATDEARKLGLTFMNWGRWGKNGHMTHFTVNGRLVEKRKGLTPPKEPVVPGATGKPKHPKVAPTLAKNEGGYKKFMNKVAPVNESINEAFESLFTEETNEHVRLRTVLENNYLVGECETVVRPVQHYANATEAFRRGLSRLPEAGQDYDALQEETQEIQHQEKVDFRAFRERLGIHRTQKETLQEGEPITEPNTEAGPILGGGPAETNDMNNGGKATSGPKKTFSSLRKKKTP